MASVQDTFFMAFNEPLGSGLPPSVPTPNDTPTPLAAGTEHAYNQGGVQNTTPGYTHVEGIHHREKVVA